MWCHYKDEKFFAVSNREGTKIRSLKKNSVVYFLVDIADRESEARPEQGVIDHPGYAVEILTQNLMRYLGSIDRPEAKDRIEIAKNPYSAIEIASLFMATWKA